MSKKIDRPTRRDFVRQASAAVFFGSAVRRLPRFASPSRDRYPLVGDPQLAALAARALDAARAAGATYAEVRFTLTDQEKMFAGRINWGRETTEQRAAVGVRALAGGGWGFSASTDWTPDEVARVGRDAASQGALNGRMRRRPIEWVSQPAVIGTWKAPITIDPFTVSPVEKLEVMRAYARRGFTRYDEEAVGTTMTLAGMGYLARRKQTTFASTEGTMLNQTHYLLVPHANGEWGSLVTFRGGYRFLDRLYPCAGGWEVLADPTLLEELPRLLSDSTLVAEVEAPDPNRCDIVCHGTVVAQLLAQTVGVAAELDRALGYEANAGGTSYLAPPDEMLGRFALGPEFFNVTANRSVPGMAATTRWDDEGVAPVDYPVITNGVVTGYHTNRALASELADWDTKHGRPVRSRGCAVAERGEYMPLIQPPNLVMAPAATDTAFDDLVASLDHGIVFIGGRSPSMERPMFSASDLEMRLDHPQWRRDVGTVSVDRQQLNGELHGLFVYEVRKGKRVRMLDGRMTEGLFRAPDLWKKMEAIGGASTLADAGFMTWKGEPGQEAAFGVRAPAARFKQVAVTDSRRKA